MKKINKKEDKKNSKKSKEDDAAAKVKEMTREEKFEEYKKNSENLWKDFDRKFMEKHGFSMKEYHEYLNKNKSS